MKFFIVSLILLAAFSSCKSPSVKPKPFELNDIIQPKITIDLKNSRELLKDACLDCLCMVGTYQNKDTTMLAFIDYHPGMIYLYNTVRKTFTAKFSIPRKCFIADVVNVYNADSIMYFNNDDNILTYCDSINIRHEYSTRHYLKDTNVSFTSGRNELRLFEGRQLFDLQVDCYTSNRNNYAEILRSKPVLGIFSFKNDKLVYENIPVYSQLKLTNEKYVIDTYSNYCINNKIRELIVIQNCSNDVSVYNFKTKKTKHYKIRNSKSPVVPVYYNCNTNEGYDHAVQKQRIGEAVYYDEKSATYIRTFNSVDQKTGIRGNTVQIMDVAFNVIAECDFPKGYTSLNLINNEILFHKYDRTNKQIIYEKYVYHR